MPPKKKKPALKDELVQATVDLVIKRWPQMNITPSMIKNPTREFVLKFYSMCIDELEDTIAQATRFSRLQGPSGFTEEQALFLKLSKIPVLMNADFKLGDLYQFVPFRVNTYIYILSHFMIYTKDMTNQAVNICDKVFDAKEELKEMKDGVEKLKERKKQEQIELANLQDNNIDLKNEAVALMPVYEKIMDFIEKSEEKCKHKLFKIEKLKDELKNYEEEIQKLEKTEQDLRSQVVTESEYNMLKEKLQSLKLEERNLEDIDLNNFLFEQNKHIEHLQMCLVKLNQLRLAEDIYKLSEYRTQFQNEQDSLRHLMLLYHNIKGEITNQQIELEKDEATNEKKSKELKKLQILTDEASRKQSDLTKQKQLVNSDSQPVIEKTMILKKLLKNGETLQEDIEQKSNALCEMQDKTMNKFRNFITKRSR